MTAEMALVRPETLRHQVENALRQAIMSGRFAPGARLIERELCETLGVSRTSVREALRRLEAEKLVRSVPHKGPVVAIMSKQEAAELYAIRGLLEGFAALYFATLKLAMQFQIPVLSEVLGLGKALFLGAGAVVLSGEVSGALPAVAILALVDMELAAHQFMVSGFSFLVLHPSILCQFV